MKFSIYSLTLLTCCISPWAPWRSPWRVCCWADAASCASAAASPASAAPSGWGRGCWGRRRCSRPWTSRRSGCSASSRSRWSARQRSASQPGPRRSARIWTDTLSHRMRPPSRSLEAGPPILWSKHVLYYKLFSGIIIFYLSRSELSWLRRYTVWWNLRAKYRSTRRRSSVLLVGITSRPICIVRYFQAYFAHDKPM